MTIEEVRKAIEKYQKEHPLHFGTMIDVTTISSKEGADIISNTIEQISKEVSKDTDIWCICEMAKLYMQGVKPVYPARPTGEWIEDSGNIACSQCHTIWLYRKTDYCPNCGAEMRGENNAK